jgi:uncharacterized membrane protein
MMARTEHQTILRMCLVAVFGALSFVLTFFGAIPYAGGAGYFNFGDIVNLFAALTLGPIEGAAVGIIGGVLSDLSNGFAMYAPWTLMAKGLMGAAAGLLYIVLKKHKIMRFSSVFVGAALDVLSYIPAYYLLVGPSGLLSSAFDCVQAFGSAILVIPLFLVVERSKVLEKLGN